VWFTLQQGRTSEVFYTPTLDAERAQPGDGRHRRGFTDRESTDMRHRTTRPDAGSLRFTQVTPTGRAGTGSSSRSSPTHAATTLEVRIRFTSLDGGRYHVYALYDPSLANNGMDDRGRTTGHTLVASDAKVSTALVSRPRFGGDHRPGTSHQRRCGPT